MFRKNSSGMSLLEVLIVMGIMGVMVTAMLAMQMNQMKTNNYLEFQLKRTQLHGTIVGQFLNDPNNCKCLFNGAAEFSAGGTTALTGVTPTQIGRYNFVTAGNCATATMPVPLANAVGIDGLRVVSINLTNIANISGAYSGNLNINIQSTKEVLGPSELPINIPVAISTTPSATTPGNVVFTGCAAQAPAGYSFGGSYSYYPQCGSHDGPCLSATSSWQCGHPGPAFSASCNNSCRIRNPATNACTCPAGYTGHIFFSWGQPGTAPVAFYNDPGVPWNPDPAGINGLIGINCLK